MSLIDAPAPSLTDKLTAAKAASRVLATATAERKDAGLRAVAAALLASIAAWCPVNLATEVGAQPPAAAQQLVTVHAPTTHSTRGSLRIWRRADGCWRLAGGPYPARLGVNGVRAFIAKPFRWDVLASAIASLAGPGRQQVV